MKYRVRHPSRGRGSVQTEDPAKARWHYEETLLWDPRAVLESGPTWDGPWTPIRVEDLP